MRPLPRPTLHTVRLGLAPALVFIATGIDRGYQTDLWQHLARGRQIVREGAIVSVDRFTFTVPGREMRDNNWLSQLAYYGLHRAGGLELIQLLNSIVLAATLAIVVHQCRRQSRSTGVAAVTGVFVFLGLWQAMLIRPQTFSMLLFVALCALLQGARRRRPLLWAVPPILALWANVHGGFAVGLALVGSMTLGEIVQPLIRRRLACARRWGPLTLCLFASALATLANPYGWRVYEYAGRLSALGVARGIEEWLPPRPPSVIGTAWVLSLLSVAALVVATPRRLRPREAVLLACFALPAAMSVRMTVWWFLAASPVAARLVGAWVRRYDRNAGNRQAAAATPTWRAAAMSFALVAACVASLPWLERWSPLARLARRGGRVESDLAFVSNALSHRAASADRLFTRMEWANYFTWSLDGRLPVMVEGHVELYPPDTWEQYVTVSDGRREWENVLDAHGVTMLVLDQTEQVSLLSGVHQSGRWRESGRYGRAIVFERHGKPGNGAVAGSGGGDF